MRKFFPLVVILLILSAKYGYCGIVDTVGIYSTEMDKIISNLVIKPNSYNVNPSVRYPVLYFLNGYSGSYLSLIKGMPEVQDYVDKYNMIIVCTDGGFNSWYFDSPVNKEVKYESFITQSLVRSIDSLYRTIKNRQKRGVAGISMGRHGALYLSIKHPNLFGAVSSISGGVDITLFPERWDIEKQLGTFKENEDRWE